MDMGDTYQRGVAERHSNGRATPGGSGGGDADTAVPRADAAKKRAAQRAAERDERESLVLWRRPLVTLHYFFQELFIHIQNIPSKLWDYRSLVEVAIVTYMLILVVNGVEGRHQPYVKYIQKRLVWCAYWFGLGVLSSIGLGTGLHTFLLYLGPHIASVTLAAYECGALNFPEPPYPDEIQCPSRRDPAWAATMWNIMCKVCLEAVMWGAGTAAGELPPYFMARAARLTGYDPDDEDDLREFNEFQQKRQLHPEDLTYIERVKVMIENLVERVGFFGILACASIPNPLFDLAGLTCGHFLVPFWTFFGATLIGKAIIKMLIQQTFVILAFNEALIAKAVDALVVIPVAGKLLQRPLKEFLAKQKEKFHRKKGADYVDHGGNWISKLIEWFSISMFLYFIVSLINAFAQSYHKRLKKLKTQKESKD